MENVFVAFAAIIGCGKQPAQTHGVVDLNSNAEKRRRELANFEIDTKSSGKRTGTSGKKSASKGSSSASTKTASAAKKSSKTTSAAFKSGTQARSSASKKQNAKAPAKKDANVKKNTVQENPLARRSSAVLQASAAPSFVRSPV